MPATQRAAPLTRITCPTDRSPSSCVSTQTSSTPCTEWSTHPGTSGTAFESLKTLIKAHESAEQRVVRPLTRKARYEAAATARNAEEEEAEKVLAELSGMGADDPGFGWMFEMMTGVADHARHEEQEEFPMIVASWTAEQRIQLGRDFLAAFARLS